MLFIPNLSRGTRCFAAHYGHRSLDNDHGLIRVFPGWAYVVSKASLNRLARVAVCGCSLKIEFEGRETQAAESWL